MYNEKKHSDYPKREQQNYVATEYDFYTGKKEGELAIYYNLAVDNIERFLKRIMADSSDDIEGDDGQSKKIGELLDKCTDENYLYLRQYLYKGNKQNKNTSGHIISAIEKSIIRKMIEKVEAIRNFHSHYWHDNKVLQFDEQLRCFVKDQYDYALQEIKQDKRGEARLFEDEKKKANNKFDLFNKVASSYFITVEGRIFFLSFFLNRGEMQQLMQMRSGFKRSDLPEYRFKRLLYTYYCHREGSSSEHPIAEKAKLAQMAAEDAQLKDMRYRQQYFKLLNYLNDKPRYFDRIDERLLYIDDRPVYDNDTLLRFIKQKGILKDVRFTKIYKDAIPEKGTTLQAEKEKIAREGWLNMRIDNIVNYSFEINHKTLYRLVVAIIDDGTMEQHFMKVLKAMEEHRVAFYERLAAMDEEAVSITTTKIEKIFNAIQINYDETLPKDLKVFYSSEQLRNIPISATLKVEELLIKWHTAFVKGKNSELNARRRLMNMIRPENVAFDERAYKTLPQPENRATEPLLFQLSYLFREQQQKSREDDSFMEWAVRFLIDHEIVKDWYWEIEQYTTIKKTNEQQQEETSIKRMYPMAQQLPAEHRIKVTDEHVIVGLRKEGTKSEDIHKQSFYLFSIGQKTMKYLLAAYFLNKDKEKVNNFLHRIKEDYLKVIKGEKEGLLLLEDYAIPAYLLNKRPDAEPKKKPIKERLKKAITKAIEKYKLYLNPDNTNPLLRMNRAEKNAIIMELYGYFDFSTTTGKKFLRKNEYEYMSMVHYMIDSTNGDKRKRLLRAFKHENLESFDLQKRLPEELYALLIAEHAGMDAYLKVLIERVMAILEGYSDTISVRKKYEDIAPLAAMMRVKLPIDFLEGKGKIAEIDAVTKARATMENFIPFVIHQAMVLKYFYKADYEQGNFGTKPSRNLLSELAQLPVNNMLHKVYYDEKSVEKYQIPAASKLSYQLKGTIRQTYYSDALLLQMALAYIQAVDRPLAEKLEEQSTTLQLDELFSKEMTISLSKAEYIAAIGNPTIKQKAIEQLQNEPDAYFFSLRLHQLDDFIYKINKQKLYAIAHHRSMRIKEELEMYKDNAAIVAQISSWNDGTKNRPYHLGDIVSEKAILSTIAIDICGYIFNFEKQYIENVKNGDVNKNILQEKLKKDYQKTGAQCDHIKFDEVIKMVQPPLSGELSNTLKNIRKNCLHLAIPLAGSLRKQIVGDERLKKLLSVTSPIGKDRTALNPYEGSEKK